MDHSAFLKMQQTVLSVFPRERILTPREVRGDYAYLRDAVQMSARKRRFSSKPGDISSASPGTVSSADDYIMTSTTEGNHGMRSRNSGFAQGSVSENDARENESAGGWVGGSGDGEGSASGVHTTATAASSSGSGEGYREEREAVEMAGGWPRVDDTRGMVLFVIDYQSLNRKCRDGVRRVSEFSVVQSVRPS